MIDIKALCYRYRNNTNLALDHLNLSINKGDFLALLGPNGCGKTTLISILIGLLKPNSGHVFINDINALKHFKQVKHQIGIVPQETALYDALSLEENLKLFGKLYGLNNKSIKEQITRCITIADLEDVRRQPIHQYSMGMRRRANLAISLIQSPNMLFLDEPTVNIDPHSRELIFKTLKRINQEGVTLLYTTHYLDEVEPLCNQVAIMKSGQIVAQASPKALIQATPDTTNIQDVFNFYVGN
jgi:ABC-2 type transport system ATP-binding protein